MLLLYLQTVFPHPGIKPNWPIGYDEFSGANFANSTVSNGSFTF